MKVYISGKITGTTDFIERFEKIENTVNKKLGSKCEIINPTKICNDIPSDATWETFMKRCIQHLIYCDAIYMMRGWRDSRGAKEELRIAKMLGIETMYEEEK